MMTTGFINRVFVIASLGACALITEPYDSLNLAPTLLSITAQKASMLGHVAHGDISVRDVSVRVREIIERETDVVRAQLRRNGISIYQGLALFLDPHMLTVQDGEDGHQLKAKNILIACGTRPAHSPEIP